MNASEARRPVRPAASSTNSTPARSVRATWVLTAACLALAAGGVRAAPFVDDAVRAKARAAAAASGLESLADVEVPGPALGDFLNATPEAVPALIQLGKALFWDMQAGSDGQACASCHFHAGADSRARNQLSPGLRSVPEDKAFGNNLLGVPGFPQFQPDYTLVPANFPFHVLADPEENDFLARAVLRDTNDVMSSMGVFAGDFVLLSGATEYGLEYVDETFNRDTPLASAVARNVRRVEPRNTPTVINAVFNHSNFWDGRAHFFFNGVSVIGPLDPAARIWVADRSGAVSQKEVRIAFSSLASQAVGPPGSDLEMSFFDRPFPMVGRKLLAATPLGMQEVDPTDSVLGALSRYPLAGLATTYRALIETAFQPRYWRSPATIPHSTGSLSLIEANFTLFWGLAIQAYEQVLVSDDAPFDRFMGSARRAPVPGALSAGEIQGLLVFLNRGARGNLAEVADAIAEFELKNGGIRIGAGNCVSCHGGAAMSDATFSALEEAPGELELIEIEDTTVLANGFLAVSPTQGLLDNGFSNIGVRPTLDDLGRGGKENGRPLAFSRQLFTHPELLAGTVDEVPCRTGPGSPLVPPCPNGTGDALADGLLVDGAFKIPVLRNVELTGPYFHNGGQATLAQVVEFYDRQSDFADRNLAEVDRNMAFIDLDEPDEEPLVQFLRSLTDERVRREQAPFDHPRLVIPNGGTRANPQSIDLPAVGAGGNAAPLRTFLGL